MSARRPDPRALVRKRAAATRRQQDGLSGGAGNGMPSTGGAGGGFSGDAGSPGGGGRMVYPVQRSSSSADDVAMLTEVVRRLEDENSRLTYDLHVAKQQANPGAAGRRGLERTV